MVASRVKFLWGDFCALTVYLQPAAGNTALMVSDQIVVDAITANLATEFVGFQKRGQVFAADRYIKGDRLYVVGFQAQSDCFQRLDNLVVNGADAVVVGIGRQHTAAAHRKLFPAPRNAGIGIHYIAVQVFSQAKTDLDGAIVGADRQAHFFGPAAITLGYCGKGIGDLMVQVFIHRHQRRVSASHTSALLDYYYCKWMSAAALKAWSKLPSAFTVEKQ